MFNIAALPTFKRTVKVSVPNDAGYEEQSFIATYKVLDTATADSFGLDTEKGSADFVRAILISLDDIVGADKKPVPYSDELRDQVIAVPYARMALVRTYMAAVGGAKAGN